MPPATPAHLGLKLERDKGMRVTNLIRNPAFIDYIILGRYEQPLILSVQERKLIVQIIPFENRLQILVTHDATESERIDMTVPERGSVFTVCFPANMLIEELVPVENN